MASTVLRVNAGGAEILNSVGRGVNGGIDRENIGRGLAAEYPFALKGIVGGTFHNEKTLLARLGLDASACVNVPLAVRAAMHFGSPDVAPDTVAFAVRSIENARVAVGDDRARVAAAEELKLRAAGEKSVVITRLGVVGHKRVGSIKGRHGVFEFFHNIHLKSQSIALTTSIPS